MISDGGGIGRKRWRKRWMRKVLKGCGEYGTGIAEVRGRGGGGEGEEEEEEERRRSIEVCHTCFLRH